MLLVNRVNVRSATTTVHALDGRTLGSFTLAAPLDAAFLDDRRVAHGVTARGAEGSGNQPAYRDVLVVGGTWVSESLTSPVSRLTGPGGNQHDDTASLAP